MPSDLIQPAIDRFHCPSNIMASFHFLDFLETKSGIGMHDGKHTFFFSSSSLSPGFTFFFGHIFKHILNVVDDFPEVVEPDALLIFQFFPLRISKHGIDHAQVLLQLINLLWDAQHLRHHFDFVIDQVLAYLLISASSAAATRVVDWELNWGKDAFTEKASASVSMSFLAFIAFAISSLISGYNICNHEFA